MISEVEASIGMSPTSSMKELKALSQQVDARSQNFDFKGVELDEYAHRLSNAFGQMAFSLRSHFNLSKEQGSNLDELSTVESTLNGQVANLQNVIVDLKNALIHISASHRELDSSLGTMKQENKALQAELTVRESKMQFLLEENKELTSRLRRTVDEREKSRQKLGNVESTIDGLKVGLAGKQDLAASAHKTAKHNAQLTAELALLEDERDKLLARLDDLKGADLRISELESNVTQLKREVSESNRAHRTSEDENKQLMDVIEQKEAEIESLREMEKSIAALNAELSTLREKMKRAMDIARQEFTAEKKELAEKIESLEASLVSKEKEVKESTKELGDWQWKAKLNQSKLDDCRNALASTQTTVTELEAALKKHQTVAKEQETTALSRQERELSRRFEQNLQRQAKTAIAQLNSLESEKAALAELLAQQKTRLTSEISDLNGILNTAPAVVDELADNEEDIATVITLIKKNTASPDPASVARLSRYLSILGEHCSASLAARAQIRQFSGIGVILRTLTDQGSDECIRYAMRCLALLTADEEVEQAILGEDLRIFVSLAQGPDEETRISCVETIVNCSRSPEHAQLLFQLGLVPSCLQWIAVDDERLVRMALMLLHNMTVTAEAKASVARLSGLKPLLHCAKSTSTAIRGHAVVTLSSLVVAPDLRNELRSLGGLPILIECLTSEDTLTAESAALSWVSLSINPKNKEEFRLKDGFAHLYGALKKSVTIPGEFRAHLVRVVCNLATLDTNRYAINSAGIIPLLTDGLTERDPIVQRYCVRALSFLAGEPKNITALFVTVDPLLACVSSADENLARDSIGALECLTVSAEVRSHVRRANGVRPILRRFNSAACSSNLRAKCETLKVIRNLCLSTECRKDVLQPPSLASQKVFLDALVDDTLRSSLSDLRRETFVLLQLLLKDTSVLDALKQSHLMENILPALDDKKEIKLLGCALACMQDLFCHQQYRSQFHTFGGIHRLLKLVDSHENTIRDAVFALVCSYAQDGPGLQALFDLQFISIALSAIKDSSDGAKANIIRIFLRFIQDHRDGKRDLVQSGAAKTFKVYESSPNDTVRELSKQGIDLLKNSEDTRR